MSDYNTNDKCPVCENYLNQDKHCFVCGYKQIALPHTIINESDSTSTITPSKEKEVSGLYGWICPKCGAVMSPYTTCCPNCTPTKPFTCTYTSI